MGRRREILCIDDDLQSLNVRRMLFESMGYQVWTELDAQQGLRSFQEHPVDAVVMDYEMPGMNGGEAAAAMKAIRPEVPVLILSALPWLPEGAPQESIDGFIHKGEPLKVLAGRISQIVPAEDEPEIETGPAGSLGGALGTFFAHVAGALSPRKKVEVH